MLLLVDNGSAYTKALAEFLGKKCIRFERWPPDMVRSESLDCYDSFILSGRRRNDKETNRVNSKVVIHAVAAGKKLLGICYGAEIMALALGGTIARSQHPQTGSQTVTVCVANPLCEGTQQVFESHAFEISTLPDGLVPLAASEGCKYEMVRYGQLPIFGTQFHPEMSDDGRCMVERFCSL